MSYPKPTLEMIRASYAGEASSEEKYTEWVENFDAVIDQVRADAWDEGANTAWKATGEGHNGEYAGPFGTHDGTVPFLRANEDITNPYRKQEEA